MPWNCLIPAQVMSDFRLNSRSSFVSVGVNRTGRAGPLVPTHGVKQRRGGLLELGQCEFCASLRERVVGVLRGEGEAERKLGAGFGELAGGAQGVGEFELV